MSSKKYSSFFSAIILCVVTGILSDRILAAGRERNEFIFADSEQREIRAEELLELDSSELRQARNEIFARKGYIFSPRTRKQFQAKAYYQPKHKSVVLNSVEEINVARIRKFEAYLRDYPEASFEASYRTEADDRKGSSTVKVRTCPGLTCAVIGELESGCTIESDIRVSELGWVYVKSSVCGTSVGPSGGYVPEARLTLIAG